MLIRRRESGLATNPATLWARTLRLTRETVLVLFMVLLVNSFVLASFQVPTGSMEDTVKTGDYLFVNKFLYGGTTPYSIPLLGIRIPHVRVPGVRGVRRGEVIVFDWPGERDQVQKPEQTWYLKRCVGLPGDTVRIENRTVWVNGERLADPPGVKFLRRNPRPGWLSHPEIYPPDSGYNEDNYGPVTVPYSGMRIPLDPRTLGAWTVLIQREGHTAEAAGETVRIDGHGSAEYVVARDYVFAIGDSRDNSLDSRFWGFIPLEDVVGTPWIVYWSWDTAIPLYHPLEKLGSVRLSRIGTSIR